MIDRDDAERLFWSLLEDGEGGEVVRPLVGVDDLAVASLAINVDRVDVGLRAAEREWRLVYFVDHELQVTSVSLFERPAFHAGVGGGFVVVLNGPSGSGKSSLMHAVLELSAEPWVMFDEPWLGTVKQPYLIWRDAAPALHRGFLDGMAALAAAGNQIILSSGGQPFEVVSDAFREVPTLAVGLDCPLDVLLEREQGREGRCGGLAEASLDDHRGWTYDLRLDSSTETPAQLASRVLDARLDR